MVVVVVMVVMVAVVVVLRCVNKPFVGVCQSVLLVFFWTVTSLWQQGFMVRCGRGCYSGHVVSVGEKRCQCKGVSVRG